MLHEHSNVLIRSQERDGTVYGVRAHRTGHDPDVPSSFARPWLSAMVPQTIRDQYVTAFALQANVVNSGPLGPRQASSPHVLFDSPASVLLLGLCRLILRHSSGGNGRGRCGDVLVEEVDSEIGDPSQEQPELLETYEAG